VTALGPAFPLVISAPSGAGKTSLARALIERHTDMVFSVSATTRAARPAERPGVDYHFVDEAGFDRMVEQQALLEWAEVHGRRYGTPRAEVEAAAAGGRTVVLDIDVQGARQVRRSFPAAVLVFILAPSGRELGRRLAGRGSEVHTQQQHRLRTARGELAAVAEFDYVIVNDDFEAALAALEAIVRAERHRVGRAGTLMDVVGTMEAELNELIEGA
jgi:guanylate kinase